MDIFFRELHLSKYRNYSYDFFSKFRENFNKYLIRDYFFLKKLRWENIKREPIEKIVVFLKKREGMIDEGIGIIKNKIKNEEKYYNQMSRGEIIDFEFRTSGYIKYLKEAKEDINKIIIYLEKILSDIDNENMYSLRRNIFDLFNFLEKWSEKDAVQKEFEKMGKASIIVMIIGGLLTAIILPLKKLKKQKERTSREHHHRFLNK